MEVKRVVWSKYCSESEQLQNGMKLALHLDKDINPVIHDMHISGNIIYFNKGMESHLYLLNLAKKLPQKFLKLTVLYELVPILLEYHYLEAAHLMLCKLFNEIEVLKAVDEFVSEPIDLDLQFEFFVGHERAHWLYENNSLLKEEAKEKLNEIIEVYSLPRNLMQLVFFPRIRKMFKSEAFIEEFCCDRNSVMYFFREIPKEKTVETIRQLSQLLYMLQLHKDLEELIGFTISKGLSKHLLRYYFDVIRGANIVQAILDKSEDATVNSQIDKTIIKNLIMENSQFYNYINNELLHLWKSDTEIFAYIRGNRTDFKSHKRYECLRRDFMELSAQIINISGKIPRRSND